jgi:PEGA domain-containing protein
MLGTVRSLAIALALVSALASAAALAGCGSPKKMPGSGNAAPATEASTLPAAGAEGAAGLPSPHAAAAPSPGSTALPARPKLHLLLRSTPAGANAAIDGRPVGTTPVTSDIDGDGKTHEFSFSLPGYLLWQVKFPPVKDGVIHATMRPIGPDGGP